MDDQSQETVRTCKNCGRQLARAKHPKPWAVCPKCYQQYNFWIQSHNWLRAREIICLDMGVCVLNSQIA